METPLRFTLPRNRILRSKAEIDALLERGEVLFRYPIKVYYLPREEASRMMVSVPKRNFKRAVMRNLLKRRIREAFRLNAHLLGEKRYDILFVYLGRETESYGRIEATLKGIFRFLAGDRPPRRGASADPAR